MKLYTKTICPKCLLVKDAFTRKGIEIELVNIEQDDSSRNFLIENNILGVPVLESDGKLMNNVSEIMELIDEL